MKPPYITVKTLEKMKVFLFGYFYVTPFFLFPSFAPHKTYLCHFFHLTFAAPSWREEEGKISLNHLSEAQKNGFLSTAAQNSPPDPNGEKRKRVEP